MKAGISIWRALRDIKDVHPAWAHVAERRYTEADLPRPITRKEDVGTLTGTKEFDESQGKVTKTNWGAVDAADVAARTGGAADQPRKAGAATAGGAKAANGHTGNGRCSEEVQTDGESLKMGGMAM